MLEGIEGRVIQLATDRGGEECFAVQFPYDPALVAECRSGPGRQSDGANKRNLIPAVPLAAQKLAAFAIRHRFSLDDETPERLSEIVSTFAPMIVSSIG